MQAFEVSNSKKINPKPAWPAGRFQKRKNDASIGELNPKKFKKNY
jgi:hypothetical protein